MKTLIRLEEAAFFLFSIFLFSQLPFAWWVYPLLLLAPDLGMLGYALGPKPGAILYNLIHHRGLALGLYTAGILLTIPGLALAGVILLGHASLDRIFGYGLKHYRGFQHTHLGSMGTESETN